MGLTDKERQSGYAQSGSEALKRKTKLGGKMWKGGTGQSRWRNERVDKKWEEWKASQQNTLTGERRDQQKKHAAHAVETAEDDWGGQGLNQSARSWSGMEAESCFVKRKLMSNETGKKRLFIL